MTIPDLIAALEAAEGPSRELDYRIAHAIGHPSMARARPDFFPPFMRRSRLDKDVPEYTRSLDAALMLVPKNFAVHDFMIWPGRSELSLLGTHEKDGQCWHSSQDGKWQGRAATAPIAACIACLRALPEATREREAGS